MRAVRSSSVLFITISKFFSSQRQEYREVMAITINQPAMISTANAR
jgi:hypothetical protein